MQALRRLFSLSVNLQFPSLREIFGSYLKKPRNPKQKRTPKQQQKPQANLQFFMVP